MESGAQSSAGGLSFGSLGFGTTPKQTSEQPKNIFGSSIMPIQTTQQPKSPFGQSNVLKNPTFTAQQDAKPTFGMNTTNTSSGALFSSSTIQPAQESSTNGNLFSSFKQTGFYY